MVRSLCSDDATLQVSSLFGVHIWQATSTTDVLMRVLTFSWEFPPKKNGGLGVACYGLVRALMDRNIEIIFVLPKVQPVVLLTNVIFANVYESVALSPSTTTLGSYGSSHTKVSVLNRSGVANGSARTVLEEVHFFAHRAAAIAQTEQFDIIHAHDWTSYTAGVAAKIASGKPLIVHAHATAFDQAAGDHVDPSVFTIEKEAFEIADKIIAVSNFTKNIIVAKYGIPAEKIVVVYNGCDANEPERHQVVLHKLKSRGTKIVLYHGRITIQKGVDYLIAAARKVVDVERNVVFIVSGWGDMSEQVMRQVASLGLSTHFIFTGPLWDAERDQMYQSADLVVMPSVSEPFGLVPLESIRHGTPVLISKQSGVSEVLTHVLKVDFWDVNEMADKIVAALRFPVMHAQLKTSSKHEAARMSWSAAAKHVASLYSELTT